MKFSQYLPLGFLALLLVVACDKSNAGLTKVKLSDGARTISVWVEIADEPHKQAQGLMGRTELPENHGMLFVFEEPRVLSFWMKNTLIPLDILYFDAQGKFVSAKSMIPCPSDSSAEAGKQDPCMTYSSGRRAQYALEVNAGFLEEEGVGEGWELQMER